MLQNVLLDTSAVQVDQTGLNADIEMSESGQSFSDLMQGQEIVTKEINNENQPVSKFLDEDTKNIVLQSVEQLSVGEQTLEGVDTADAEQLDIQIQQLLSQNNSEILLQNETVITDPSLDATIVGNALPLSNEPLDSRLVKIESSDKNNKRLSLEGTLTSSQIKSETILASAKAAETVIQNAQTISEEHFTSFAKATATQPSVAMAAPIEMMTALKKDFSKLAKVEASSAIAVDKSLALADSPELDSLEIELSADTKRVVDVKRFEAAFNQRIQVMIQQGKQVAEIRLDPPQLGKIDVAMNSQGNEINVAISVENTQIKELIEKSIAQLQQALAKDDTTQVNVNVSSGNADGAFANEDGEDNQEPKNGSGINVSNDDADSADVANKVTLKLTRLLDVFT